MKKKMFKFSIIILIFFLIGTIYIYSVPILNKPVKSDVIIILGCRVNGTQASEFLARRVDVGANLYKQGFADNIIVSGGMGDKEDISEAECMKNILIKSGIDSNKIILEDESRNTSENIKFSSKIMKKLNYKNAIIVSNNFHLRRTKILTKKNNLKATFKGFTSLDLNHIFPEVYGVIREIPAIIKDSLIN